ncbi:hypothetical protein OM076_09225 [Solirubrobacter ginsenosidimutans]|uniref:Uncharacterized protein n=1 Tax=Solirubrobacter ginsenosidimutans TaxID=490573 RepID=A0A9X3MPI4_9ACTN|nr:hypothetical protein [Solirubrobacter ginsenosidimutans]MDA0160446.1 hypothetical protein [Solirubrobacter ginsenosidimutans]
MSAHHAPTAPLQAIFDAAKQFGLTDDEVWQAVNECFRDAEFESAVGDCLDELVIALARRILVAAGR